MIGRTRWVGLWSVLSVSLLGACGVKSKCEPEPSPCSGLAGDGSTASAGSVGAAAGTSNAGGGGPVGGAASTSSAGTSNAGAGAAGSSLGGTGGASAGTTGGGGGGGGGAGGTHGGGSCGGAQVLFLIQRSGALFEQPGVVNTGEVLPLAASYFGFLQAALSGEGSATQPYRGKLPIGVSFMFAARDLNVSPLPAVCPQLTATAPSLQFDAALSTAFTQGAADHAALVSAKQKEEAPVPEAIANVVASWSVASGPRHLVLITAGMPDTCTKFDGPCGIDATAKAVQDAKAAGVTTHVIGLGHDLSFNYTITDPDLVTTQTGYEEYLQQLANAGSGKPLGAAMVEKLGDYVCNGDVPATLTASYTGAPGDAKYYEVKTATDAKTAVADILANICP